MTIAQTTRSTKMKSAIIPSGPPARATKIFRILLSIIALYTPLHAGKPLVAESPVEICTDAFTISIASAPWTKVPTAQCAGRTGVFLNNLSGNTGTIRCIPTASSTVPTVSTATYAVWELTPLANASFLPGSDKVYFWCITTNTSAESASGVEVKQ
jgi:hypothetical protein